MIESKTPQFGFHGAILDAGVRSSTADRLFTECAEILVKEFSLTEDAARRALDGWIGRQLASNLFVGPALLIRSFSDRVKGIVRSLGSLGQFHLNTAINSTDTDFYGQ
jgi:hypothetical protein